MAVPHISALDTLGRPLRSLRISVTDRCNLRCLYCMPEKDYVWLPREDLLRFEEIAGLAGLFCELGVTKVRLTGGEPLLRKDLPRLVRMLAANPRVTDLAMTTNGALLGELAGALRDAGLARLNISLDTLRRDRFEAFTRTDALPAVLAGIEQAQRAGFTGTKLDAVILRGHNDDEICGLLEFGKQRGIEVRFLEYMDVPGATQWSMSHVFTGAEILEVLRRRYGHIEPWGEQGSAPAQRFRTADGTLFGIIASTTAPFCRACDRSRLTADGMWFLCLYATRGINIREALRAGASADELKTLITQGWQRRDDRGAELRLHSGPRHAFIPLEGLKRDPHLEMHTRGG